MLNWLKKRLSPIKKDTKRWCDLATALEEYWENLFDPLFEYLSQLRSIYTADEAGQLRKIAEYGGYYEQDMLPESRPIYFAMRKLEMLQKETDVPMMASIQRLGVTGCSWQPLYAMKGEPYGSRFLTSIRLGWENNPQLAYLTSRGILMVDFSLLNDPTLLPKLVERVRNIKPLHIIYDGMAYFMPQTGNVYAGGCLVTGEIVSVHPPEISVSGNIYVGGACCIVETVTVYLQE